MRFVPLILLGLSLTSAAALAAPPAAYGPRIHRLRFDIPAVDVRENLFLEQSLNLRTGLEAFVF